MLQKCNKIGDALNEVGWWRLLSRGLPHEGPTLLNLKNESKKRGVEERRVKNGGCSFL